MLQKWIDTRVFWRATAEGWNHALGYYTTADPAYKKANERWLETKRALEGGTLTDMPLYEFWRGRANLGARVAGIDMICVR